MAQEEMLSRSKKSPNAFLQYRLSRVFGSMDGKLLEKDREDLDKVIKKRSISSYSDLFKHADKEFPADIGNKLSTTMSEKDVEKMFKEFTDKKVHDRLSRYQLKGDKFEQTYKWFKEMFNLQSKGMDYATYQIRVGGVAKKNHSKFDELYKEVTAFFLLMSQQHRPLNAIESRELEKKFKVIQQEIRKAKRIIRSKPESFIQSKLWGFRSTGSHWFRRGVFEEFDVIDEYLEQLVLINQYEKEFESIHPSDSFLLRYFYSLSWKMYNLLEDSFFKKKKDKTDFAKFTHTFLTRFLEYKGKNSWETTKDSLRKNTSWQKMRRLNLHKIKSVKQHKEISEKLFT